MTTDMTVTELKILLGSIRKIRELMKVMGIETVMELERELSRIKSQLEYDEKHKG